MCWVDARVESLQFECVFCNRVCVGNRPYTAAAAVFEGDGFASRGGAS